MPQEANALLQTKLQDGVLFKKAGIKLQKYSEYVEIGTNAFIMWRKMI